MGDGDNINLYSNIGETEYQIKSADKECFMIKEGNLLVLVVVVFQIVYMAKRHRNHKR